MYIPLDYWMTCDFCGGKYRRSEMREHWTGQWVHYPGCWEPRHPQDFVESIPDDTSVPVARPAIAQAVGETTVYANVLIWTTTVYVSSTSGMNDKEPIGIVMNNGATHWSFIDGDPVDYTKEPLMDENGEILYDSNNEIILTTDSVTWGAITLNTPIPFKADSGNTIYLPGLNNESWT